MSSGPAAETGLNQDLTQGVVLDVGPDRGALVVLADEKLLGKEIEAGPRGDLRSRQHAVVHRRRTGNGWVFAAVFPSLPAGDYDLWRGELEPSVRVTLASGRVTEVNAPG